MADKEKNTYEKVHKQLSDAMQDAYINDVLKDIKEPNIDLSFLADDSKKKRKHSKLLRVASIAAVTIIVLLGANIALLSSDSMDAYGDKGILHRLYEGINGIFTDEDDSESTDVLETFETTDEGDIDKAKKFFPQLYIPEYIPPEYSLESLSIQGLQSGNYMWSYLYNNQGDAIEITGLYYGDSYDYTYQNQQNDEIIDLSDRKISVTWEDSFEEYYVTVYTESGTIDIGMHGHNDREKLISIAKGLQK
ncbi:MAG: hypothetical protein IJA01_08825 [Firmicutes bacterium]|nr:hypothetical protein [Bacillota bacterium]